MKTGTEIQNPRRAKKNLERKTRFFDVISDIEKAVKRQKKISYVRTE